jgi:hypothetical protein
MIKVKLVITFLTLLGAGLALGLGGCAATLINYSAEAKKIDPQTSYPPVEPYKVVFFSSKGDFPPDLHAVLVADLSSPMNTNWSYDALLREFLKKAGELGANAVVLERLDKEDTGLSDVIYKGTATAYRITKQNQSEIPDLNSFYGATQNPDPPASKSKVIYSYPGMSSQ